MIIFDWDGTLCDSVSHIVKAVQSTAATMGLPVPDDAAAANIIGLGLPQAMAKLFPELDEQEIAALIDGYSGQYVATESSPPRLFRGAMTTLNTLKQRGLEVAVATGKSRRGLERMLDVHGLTDFFHATRCAEETRSKPDPLMIEQIMAERAVLPEQVIVVGDTEYDLEMAANAGVASIGVSFGAHSAARLRRHQPLAIVDDLRQLLDLPALSRR
ncbi:HAD-IA family hydrolase [Pseudohalioglobus sediminis]|uniref:HAD-IA family hydrolase n=1 Tax=Pseudohalioglobus sediminis TaxID=2606449 RepID=A0A5B0X3N5_9GAMM|nr:HAD-IA family hydrolase [Pseudohalioglobus sediminis]KAA1193157.1 HAD-IA family hydrolase [Pseudohalioglobus sediminis]